jgi:hypothetical protein
MRTAIVCGALALAVTTAVAQTAVVEDYNSANLMLPGCKTALTAQVDRSFLAGMCVGYVRAIAVFTATPRDSVLCTDPPAGVTPEQMIGVVVRYVEARPQRMHEPFMWLATDALLDAWPCRK